MPIGVPRIIYCWGEELPAQWTDIYNFIFRRRMVFLMQYLDDELCNQICGLLINIHMEDRSKELEKKEMERSGVFKTKSNSSGASSTKDGVGGKGTSGRFSPMSAQDGQGPTKKSRSMEDLLNGDEDLGIDDMNTLEQYTLQKITTEWLNWNAQFFDYADEPYLFYLADVLAKDFNQSEIKLGLNHSFNVNKLPSLSKVQMATVGESESSAVGFKKEKELKISAFFPRLHNFVRQSTSIYAPFRTHVPFASTYPSAQSDKRRDDALLRMLRLTSLIPSKMVEDSEGTLHKSDSLQQEKGDTQNASLIFTTSSLPQLKIKGQNDTASGEAIFADQARPSLPNNTQWFETRTKQKSSLFKKLLSEFVASRFVSYSNIASKGKQTMGTPKVKGQQLQRQRQLRREFTRENLVNQTFTAYPSTELAFDRYSSHSKGASVTSQKGVAALRNANPSFLDPSMTFDSSGLGPNEFRDYYRKQTERTFMEEESKKVFVIINSFGGSVGNGITVHDALQFIKAGSLTLALGVAASAASLALAGGTIGERYVTEGCHCMIHQPESSLQGQASDIWIDSQEIMKIRLDVAEIYSLSTYRPRHKILRDLDRDFYLTATETIHYGLADEIATNEVMHSILEMTNNAWNYENSKQERLLESRVNLIGNSAQTQEST
jgi:ATP-dependent Clp protease protease subunit